VRGEMTVPDCLPSQLMSSAKRQDGRTGWKTRSTAASSSGPAAGGCGGREGKAGARGRGGGGSEGEEVDGIDAKASIAETRLGCIPRPEVLADGRMGVCSSSGETE
jgi:hypothetical protein